MNLFDYIKKHISIVSVIQEYVSLKKTGLYLKSPCPFHSEKTASFTVSPHKEIFYCFGCNEGGDVITFICKIENCQPIEAVNFLSDRYNIALPEDLKSNLNSTFNSESQDKKKRYFELYEIVSMWCHEQLLNNHQALNYIKNRGYSDEIIKQFSIGYFPDDQKIIKNLISYLHSKSFLLKDLLDSGFINESKGVYFSAFSLRIIFPIKDNMARHCGFGARIFNLNDQRSKYYNSHDNDFFHKGLLLFGLDIAKKNIQKEQSVFLVEGYTDCISMVQSGYKNTVATLGTACTIEHLQQLSHYAQTIFILYDGDKAGQNATLRLAQLCWQTNLDLKVLILPENHDPASYLIENKNLNLLLEKTEDIFTFFINSSGKNFSQLSLSSKLSISRQVIDVIKKIDDNLKQDILLKQAALIFELPFETLKSELISKEDSSFNKNELKIEKIIKEDELSLIEKMFIFAILNDKELLNRDDVINIIEYMPGVVISIVESIKKSDKNDFDSFVSFLSSHDAKIVYNVFLSFQEESLPDFDQILYSIEKKYWKIIINNTKLKLTYAQQNSDFKCVDKIMNEFLKLKKKLLNKGSL